MENLFVSFWEFNILGENKMELLLIPIIVTLVLMVLSRVSLTRQYSFVDTKSGSKDFSKFLTSFFTGIILFVSLYLLMQNNVFLNELDVINQLLNGFVFNLINFGHSLFKV